ncbi:hypothetical protein [Maritimibacter harenae]|nr:hypothetical protein [Maritimibacter harenae]
MENGGSGLIGENAGRGFTGTPDRATIGGANRTDGDFEMISDLPDGLTSTVICGLCGGETDDLVDSDDCVHVRCNFCDNQATLEEARGEIAQFIEDYQMNQIKAFARDVGERHRWIDVDTDPVPEPAFRFVLKPTQS